MQILDALKADAETRRRENFDRLRALLEKSIDNNGTLKDKDQATLAALVAELALSVETIGSYIRNLEGVRKADADALKLTQLRPELAEATEAVSKWATDRAAKIAALDEIGRPLLLRHAELEQTVGRLTVREHLATELKEAQKELWAITPPPPPRQLSDNELAEAQTDAFWRERFNVYIVGIIEGNETRESVGDEGNTAIELGLKKGWTFRQETEPLTRDRLPEGQQEDPRIARIKSLANRIQNGNESRQNLSRSQNAALDLAIADGIIDASKWPEGERRQPNTHGVSWERSDV